MEEKIVKVCRCHICDNIIEIKPSEKCPEHCPACNDGKGGHWEHKKEEKKYVRA